MSLKMGNMKNLQFCKTIQLKRTQKEIAYFPPRSTPSSSIDSNNQLQNLAKPAESVLAEHIISKQTMRLTTLSTGLRALIMKRTFQFSIRLQTVK